MKKWGEPFGYLKNQEDNFIQKLPKIPEGTGVKYTGTVDRLNLQLQGCLIGIMIGGFLCGVLGFLLCGIIYGVFGK